MKYAISLIFLLFLFSSLQAESKAEVGIIPKLTEAETKDAPILQELSIYPEFGVPCTHFTYKVIYSDSKNRSPEYIKIWLNGTWHNMKPTGETAINGNTKGDVYFHDYIPKDYSTNFYYFEASNGVGKARAGIIDSPNNAPLIYAEPFNNNQVLFFNKDSSKPIWIFETGNDIVSNVTISKDSKYIAAVTFTSIYLFSAESNKPVWQFCLICDSPPIPLTSYAGIAISENGDYIAGTLQNNLYVFQKESNNPILKAKLDTSAIGLDISADGQYIAIGVANTGEKGDKVYFFSRDSTQPLWTYKAIHPDYTQTGNFYSPDITPDGTKIAISTGCPDRKGYLFSTTGEILFQTPQLTEDSPVHKSAISDAGDLIAFSLDHQAGQEQLILFNSSGKRLWSFSSSSDSTARALSLSADGKSVAIGTSAGNLYFFSTTSNKPSWKFSAGAYYQIGDIKFNSSGNYLVAGSTDKKVYLFSKSSNKPVWQYTSNSWINSVDFSDNYIVAGTGMSEYEREGSQPPSSPVTCSKVIEPISQSELMQYSNSTLDNTTENKDLSKCGDLICNPDYGETPDTCSSDCHPENSKDDLIQDNESPDIVCGDGICISPEEDSSCQSDCSSAQDNPSQDSETTNHQVQSQEQLENQPNILEQFISFILSFFGK